MCKQGCEIFQNDCIDKRLPCFKLFLVYVSYTIIDDALKEYQYIKISKYMDYHISKLMGEKKIVNLV